MNGKADGVWEEDLGLQMFFSKMTLSSIDSGPRCCLLHLHGESLTLLLGTAGLVHLRPITNQLGCMESFTFLEWLLSLGNVHVTSWSSVIPLAHWRPGLGIDSCP